MKIGVIIPTRGDRPDFLNHAQYLLSRQTVLPNEIYFVDYAPTSTSIDITQRYRAGYDYFRGRDCDVLFLWEDDDWYSPIYIESQLTAWIAAGRPDLFGTTFTHYYHIGLRKRYRMDHFTRCSAMATLIKPDLQFQWCKDSEPYTDSWLYSQLQYKLWTPPSPIAIGIKHGVGMVGGHAHVSRLRAYTDYNTSADDTNGDWLRAHVDQASFEFYWNYFAAAMMVR